MLTSLASQANTKKVDPIEPIDPPIEEQAVERDYMGEFIEKNKEISSWLDRKVEQVDLFLVGKSKSNIKNNSSFRVINSTGSFEGDNFKNNTTISINPKLPNLERFLRINLSTYVERDAYLRSQRNLQDENEELQDQDHIDLNQPKENLNWVYELMTFDAYFEPRIQLSDPLQISNTLGFKSQTRIGKLQIDPKFEFFADATKGLGVFKALNFTYHLSRSFEFRLSNEGEYEDRINKYTVNNGLTLNQLVSDRNSLGYGVALTSTNRPNYHLKSYRTFVLWNHTFYKKVIDFQLIPEVEFERARGFRGLAGVTFNLIVSF